MSSQQCISIRGKEKTKERCPYKSKAGESWCGHHAKQKIRVAFVAPGTNIARIKNAWRRYIARRAGPLLWVREESNNPTDFYTTEPVETIPLQSFVSFVDKSGKGYIMNIESAVALVLHAHSAGEEPLNPFNREPLPAIFLRRILRHKPTKDANPIPVATIIDLFRTMEDLGYYTDPTWLSDLTHVDLVRLYIELAHIWHTSAGLTVADRYRIVPIQTHLFMVPVRTIPTMDSGALKQLILDTCKLFVSSATTQSDRQLGVMYVIGALSIIHRRARQAYPWMFESVAPGVTRNGGGGQLIILHPAAMEY
jgi:hypothetical protein